MSTYVKLPRAQEPAIEEEEKTPLRKAVERQQEREDQVLLSGNWTDREEPPSLASTATTATITKVDGEEMKQVLMLNPEVQSGRPNLTNPLDSSKTEIVIDDNDNNQLVIPLQERERSNTSSDDFSLPADTIAQEDHIDDMLNQAILDTTLEDIQSLTRKRPKGLLLGNFKLFLSITTYNSHKIGCRL